ncbi:MAG: Na(+)-translocating NADH-quinone reductase subunit A [Bacteroidales bacterium]|nr:Na(+)-translocating NADH-quinone reductase subunit A [Bacteroidales bacterium]
MPETITIRKGLDIPVDGSAALRVTDARNVTTCAVKPVDFVGLTPRLLVEEEQQVQVGDALFCDKQDERIRFTSPANGIVKAVVRGEKRKLLEVVVEAADNGNASYPLPKDADELRETMLRCGLWTMLRQRPFGTVANPDAKPKAVFVSGFDSAPLAPDYDFLMQGREAFLAKGLEALAMLSGKTVHLCLRPDQRLVTKMSHYTLPQLHIHLVKGPHPAGNIGTQIAHIDPINKGEVVWTMNLQDVAVLGELVSTGTYRPEKLVALAGPQLGNAHYFHVRQGACVAPLLSGQLPHADFPKMQEDSPKGSRVISGDILCGTQIAPDGFLGAYDSLLSVIPEGDYYDFMGWLLPGFRKFSFSRTFLSGFMPKSSCKPLGITLPRFANFWKIDTNTHGDVRPLVFTGNFERVFPFDIYPTQLIKACIVGDVDLMENLGIYEVEPEDFALCEFIDTSKTDIQPIIREALEKLRKEAL